MDRKSVITLAICGALFVLWYYLTPRLYPPVPPGSTNVPPAMGSESNRPAPGPRGDAGSTAANVPGGPLTPTSFEQPLSTAPEQTVALSNELVRLTFTSRGGGIQRVELLRHRESVACGAKRKAGGDRPVSLNGAASLPILALAGQDALVGDGVYRLSLFNPTASPSTNSAGAAEAIAAAALRQGVRAEKLLSNEVFIVKEFELGPHYLIEARVRFENRGANAIALPPQNWMVGAATPLNPQDNEQSVGLMWFDGGRANQVNEAYFEPKTLGCFPGTPRAEYSMGNPNIRWAAAKNQFFFVAVMPEAPAVNVAARKFALPPPSREEIESDAKTRTNQFAFNVVITQPGTNVAAGAAVERSFHIYAGPKEYQRLERLAGDLGNEIDRLMEFGFFGFFSRLLLFSMNLLNSIGFPYALAIVSITVIIKLLFWPLTQASTRSMKRMQALQPQMKALQEKYKDDPTKMNKKLMEFMKENKVSPLGGCLPVMLQVPVFIGFFQMVRTAIELRGASFLWACDLSRPDTIFVIPGLNFNVNPLPLVMGVTMFWQARLTPPSPGMDPMQQKMMKYFPLIFLFILYDYSAGLTLYWTVQNLLSIAQTKLTRINDQKKGGDAGKTAPAALGPRRKK